MGFAISNSRTGQRTRFGICHDCIQTNRVRANRRRRCGLFVLATEHEKVKKMLVVTHCKANHGRYWEIGQGKWSESSSECLPCRRFLDIQATWSLTLHKATKRGTECAIVVNPSQTSPFSRWPLAQRAIWVLLTLNPIWRRTTTSTTPEKSQKLGKRFKSCYLSEYT